MRRLLMVGLLLLLASSAGALPLLLVKGSKTNAGSEREEAIDLAMFKAALDVAGVLWDEISPIALKTEWIRTGVIGLTTGGTKAYAAVVLEQADMLRTSYPVGVGGVPIHPESLLIMAKNAPRGLTWPTVPLVWLGPSNSAEGASIWANAIACAACSTGAGSLAGPSYNNKLSTAHTGPKYPFYSPYVDGHWNPWGSFNRVPIPTGTPGTVRSIVRVETARHVTSNADISGANFVSSQETCLGCMGPQVGATPLAADTATVWDHYRDPAEPPIVFSWPLGSGGIAFSVSTALITIAHLDSLCGGTLVGQRPGWTPLKVAMHLQGGFASSNDATTNSDYASRAICMAGSATDTAIAFATIATLSQYALIGGIPFTLDANPDSVAAFAYQLRWFNPRLWGNNLKVCPSPWVAAGGGVNGSNAGNAGLYQLADVFGMQRPRAWLRPGAACSPTDTTVDCFVQWAFNRLDSIPTFRGFVAKAIVPAYWDYIPMQYNRGWLPPADSLAIALTRAGCRVLVVNTEATFSTPACTRCVDFNNNVAATLSTDPRALGAGESFLPAYSTPGSGLVVGGVKIAATRGQIRESVSNVLNLSHNWEEEFWWGAVRTQGPWHLADYPNYYHTFHSHLSVFTVPLSLLGCSHGTNGVVRAPGYEQAVSFLGQILAINSMAWPGHKLIKPVFLDDL